MACFGRGVGCVGCQKCVRFRMPVNTTIRYNNPALRPVFLFEIIVSIRYFEILFQKGENSIKVV